MSNEIETVGVLIRDLPPVTEITGRELIEVEQDGVSRQAPLSDVVPRGHNGKSALEIAIEQDPTVTDYPSWVSVLKGKDGKDGRDIYQVALDNGFEGSEQELLASLKGTDGKDGFGIYDLAVAEGFVGTEAEYLASLKGTNGKNGEDGKDGDDGKDGLSAYDLAKLQDPQVGSLVDWLASLQAQPVEFHGPIKHDALPSSLEIPSNQLWLVLEGGVTNLYSTIDQTWVKHGTISGPRGASALEVVQQHDPSVTDYETWVATLKGRDGKDGDDGKDGEDFAIAGFFDTLSELESFLGEIPNGEYWRAGTRLYQIRENRAVDLGVWGAVGTDGNEVVSTTGLLDLSQGLVFTLDASQARTVTVANTPPAERSLQVLVEVLGDSLVNWPAEFVWCGNGTPSLGTEFTIIHLLWTGRRWIGTVGATA